ncbi:MULTISPECIES: NAD-dependent epimerase/dehydratase family protein [Bacteroides]|jgi:CDP-paratose synthetase|uniref:NAD-dependent epimerase/dehydratase family protein n=1 Tax=Bacteroides TaxID=816 RepID=UPI00101BEFCB|nr:MULTISPECIES: NAD(P)-dependent oxidoreductase [Bacteroides]MBU8972248.1 NAD(P)-dependent oxidoreductase [Bacteroides eggerthii]MBU8997048.1 NAD(P)-dependent oxidoreductase [Bacteroides eggerthii]MCG4758504.1 NAD(P)-dependent oxidoreductase [Bacteroides eggerthii]
MKILITGATGFVGRTVVSYFALHAEHELCLLVRSIEKVKTLFPSASYAAISTTERNWQHQIINYAPDVVLHLAAYFTNKRDEASAEQLINSNILFTTNLLEAVSHTCCRYFINIGTFTEFLNGAGEALPNNLYSATKSAERPVIQFYQTQSNWKWINVIVYSPYGRKNENKKVIDYLLDAVDATTSIAFSPGKQMLDFIHVDDMADFFLTLINKLDSLQEKYYQFHLGTGQGHTIREVAQVMECVFHKSINAHWGGRDYLSSDVMHAVAPINKIIDLLGWTAKISLEEGIRILYDDINCR